MNRFVKFAAPAALALAAFGAQAADASIAGQFTPSAGGQYKGMSVQAPAAGSETSRTSVAQPRDASFLGA